MQITGLLGSWHTWWLPEFAFPALVALGLLPPGTLFTCHLPRGHWGPKATEWLPDSCEPYSTDPGVPRAGLQLHPRAYSVSLTHSACPTALQVNFLKWERQGLNPAVLSWHEQFSRDSSLCSGCFSFAGLAHQTESNLEETRAGFAIARFWVKTGISCCNLRGNIRLSMLLILQP